MAKIVVIPGDGIGEEITRSAVAVLKAADKKYNLGLEYEFHEAGGTAAHHHYVVVRSHRATGGGKG